MREIKFRGKRVDNNQWVYGYLTHTNKKMNPCIHIGVVEVYEVDPKSVGQFTGLLDKNGKEIYEGDIVKVKIDHETRTSYMSVVEINYDGAIVKAHPGHIKMGIGLTRLVSDYCGRYSTDCEVVGNIYEHPTLIK